jgi:hypothetical protein
MNTSRISLVGGGLMIAFAGLVDFIQFLFTFIPFIGMFLSSMVTFVVALIFGIWFSHNEMSMMDPKRILRFLGTMLGEFTPGINAVPIWTGSVSYTVIQEWRTPAEI